MLTIHCSGSPYEIGYEHGTQAAVQVKQSMEFYTGLFKQKSKLDWPGVRQVAVEYAPHVHTDFPELEQEMQGLADGAGVDYLDILSMNVRTEIAFGLFDDGCTALAWKTSTTSFLGQNWDWNEAQKRNLVVMNIEQVGKPKISMITEAGIVGKIGLNSSGVGVCLNAIRVKGADASRTPVHLCLRLILESENLAEAVAAVEKFGCSSSAHMLVADPNGSVGIETTDKTVVKLPMDAQQRVFHTNHLLKKPEGIVDTGDKGDTLTRLVRIKQLADKLGDYPDEEDISSTFRDEDNYPIAICRAQVPGSDGATLFNIVMDLTARVATVTMGRPVDPEETVVLNPSI